MDSFKDALPFKPTVMGVAVFLVAVVAAVYVGRKIPVLNKLA